MERKPLFFMGERTAPRPQSRLAPPLQYPSRRQGRRRGVHDDESLEGHHTFYPTDPYGVPSKAASMAAFT